jgi:hypothetical protein
MDAQSDATARNAGRVDSYSETAPLAHLRNCGLRIYSEEWEGAGKVGSAPSVPLFRLVTTPLPSSFCTATELFFSN